MEKKTKKLMSNDLLASETINDVITDNFIDGLLVEDSARHNDNSRGKKNKFRSRYDNFRRKRPSSAKFFSTNNDFTFEIVQNIKVLGVADNGWTKEFNIVKFNDYAPRLDIRDWNSTHSKMSKGIGLTIEEGLNLKEALNNLDQEMVANIIN